MTANNDGGLAFPVPMFTRQSDGQPMSAGDFFEGGNGMLLRDWFAGMALMGIMTNAHGYSSMKDESIASSAWSAADAMIAAREHTKK